MLLVLVVGWQNEKNWKPFEVKSYLAPKPAQPAEVLPGLCLLQTKQNQLSILSLPSHFCKKAFMLCFGKNWFPVLLELVVVVGKRVTGTGKFQV